MGKSISESLIKLFSKNRLVFWHDKNKNMWEEFQEIKIKGVEKVEINNNEFSLKYKILKEKPYQKFLIYKNELADEHKEDNWLLDIELYSAIFTTDKIKIWMSELELETYYIDTVKEHRIFFNSEKRRKSLKGILKKEDNLDIFKRKLLLSISESEEDIEGLIGKLFEESFLQKEDKLKLIRKCNLEKYMWDLFDKEYNYKNVEPKIYDFALQLFPHSLLPTNHDLQSLKI